MIQAQLRSREFFAAILTAIVVAGKDVATVKLYRLLGYFLIEEQPDDSRNLNLCPNRANPVLVVPFELPAPLANLAPALEVIRRVLPMLEADNLGQCFTQQAKE